MFVWLALAHCATQCECRAQKEGERTNFGSTKAAQSKSGLSMWTYNVLSCISVAVRVLQKSRKLFCKFLTLSLSRPSSCALTSGKFGYKIFKLMVVR